MKKTILEQYIDMVQENDDIDPTTTGTRFQVDMNGGDEDEEMSDKKKQILIKVNRLLRNRQVSVQSLISEFLDSMDTHSIMDAYNRVDAMAENEYDDVEDIDDDDDLAAQDAERAGDFRDDEWENRDEWEARDQGPDELDELD